MTTPPRIALTLTSVVLLVAVVLGAAPRTAAALTMTWRLQSVVDPVSGALSCRVISLGDDIAVSMTLHPQKKTVIWSVAVGYDNTPGSLRYLRIDGEIFQTAEPSFQGAEAAEIAARFLTPSPGLFVFEWFSGANESKRGGLYAAGNFYDKAALCEAWLWESSI